MFQYLWIVVLFRCVMYSSPLVCGPDAFVDQTMLHKSDWAAFLVIEDRASDYLCLLSIYVDADEYNRSERKNSKNTHTLNFVKWSEECVQNVYFELGYTSTYVCIQLLKVIYN